MNIETLLKDVTENITGEPIKINRTRNAPIPMQIWGLQGGTTVVLEGTITDGDPSEAQWCKVSGGKWTSNICEGLYINFSYVRAVVENYAGGSVNMVLSM